MDFGHDYAIFTLIVPTTAQQNRARLCDFYHNRARCFNGPYWRTPRHCAPRRHFFFAAFSASRSGPMTTKRQVSPISMKNAEIWGNVLHFFSDFPPQVHFFDMCGGKSKGQMTYAYPRGRFTNPHLFDLSANR